MKKQHEIYSGKAKTIYATEDENIVILHFRDDATAFDGAKKASLDRKGLVNNYFNAFISNYLATNGIKTHFIDRISDRESRVNRLDMIPIECVVRNFAAGSLTRRLGIKEGAELNPPIFEFFLKNDNLHDPMINTSYIETFQWAEKSELDQMKEMTLKVNQILSPLFAKAGLLLVDYKLEFGRFHNEIQLGDEFTPDGCRIWDQNTKEKLDKDRFRQDLGDVIQSYELVAERLGIQIG